MKCTPVSLPKSHHLHPFQLSPDNVLCMLGPLKISWLVQSYDRVSHSKALYGVLLPQGKNKLQNQKAQLKET